MGVFRIIFYNKLYYYCTEELRQIRYPYPLNSAWKERVLEATAGVFLIPSTRSRAAHNVMMTTHVDTEATIGGRTEEVEESPKNGQEKKILVPKLMTLLLA
jgi:hypothetical protein